MRRGVVLIYNNSFTQTLLFWTLLPQLFIENERHFSENRFKIIIASNEECKRGKWKELKWKNMKYLEIKYWWWLSSSILLQQFISSSHVKSVKILSTLKYQVIFQKIKQLFRTQPYFPLGDAIFFDLRGDTNSMNNWIYWSYLLFKCFQTDIICTTR